MWRNSYIGIASKQKSSPTRVRAQVQPFCSLQPVFCTPSLQPATFQLKSPTATKTEIVHSSEILVPPTRQHNAISQQTTGLISTAMKNSDLVILLGAIFILMFTIGVRRGDVYKCFVGSDWQRGGRRLFQINTCVFARKA